eukprot:GHVU01213111.1.p1 GENE.GHVU01213111.1~~GHVU01213111.1.p1  ORF type:complete len:119 (+),score=2.32 GHVU01213111.1:356-712(+)
MRHVARSGRRREPNCSVVTPWSLLKTRPPTLAGPAARRAGGTTRDCLPEVTTDSLRDRSMMEAQKTNRSHLPGYYARVHTHRYAPTAAFAACMHPCNGGPVGCPDKRGQQRQVSRPHC